MMWAASGLEPTPQASGSPSPASMQTPALVFGAQANIVRVDAVVTDKNGRQVTSLVAEDFEIESDGRKHRVSLATYVPLVEDAEAPDARSGGLEARDVRRVIAFLVSRPVIEVLGPGGNSLTNLSQRLPGTERLDRMFKTFAERDMKSRDVVALVNQDSLKGLLTQFTSDRALFLSAVRTLRKDWTNPGVPPLFVTPGNHSAIVHYCRDVIAAARAIVARMKSIPGRRMLFLSTGILRISDGGGSLSHGFSELARDAKELVESANQAGVTLYGINPNGLPPAGTDASLATSPTPFGMMPMPFATGAPAFSEALGYLADGTGGSTIENTNLLSENLSKVMDLNRGYYLLGYDPGEAPTKLARKVKVRVRRDGTRVHARPQVYEQSAIAGTDGAGEDALKTLLNSPVARSGVGVRVWPYLRWTGAKAGEFEAVIEIDPETLNLGEGTEGPSIDLELLARFTDERGTVVKADLPT